MTICKPQKINFHRDSKHNSPFTAKIINHSKGIKKITPTYTHRNPVSSLQGERADLKRLDENKNMSLA